MDPRKKEIVLQMIQSLWGRHVNDLSDGQFFIHVLSLLKKSFQKKHLLTHRVDRLESTRTFLQEIYGKERVEKYLNFDILLCENCNSSQDMEKIDLELNKIALVLYGIGVLDKNGRIFTESALKLPLHMHADIMELIQSVVQAGSVALLLNSNIEAVLKISPENPNSPTPYKNQSLLSTTSSTPKSTRSVSFSPAGEKEPQCGASKIIHHNRSFSEVTSLLRDLSIHSVSPSSPLVQFMQSPQVVQKASIRQKDLEIKKLKKELTDERYLKDELQDTLREQQSQNAQKDLEITRLQARIKSLFAYQDAADELQELKIKYEDLEHESKKIHSKLKDFENFKERVKFLEKLTDSQCEELEKFSNEKKLFESERKKNLMNLKTISHLESQVHYLELQLKELNNCKTAWEREKDSLLENLEAAKDKINVLRNELDEMQAGINDSAQGESMGVVLELQIQDIRRELQDITTDSNTLQSRLDDQLRDMHEKDEEISRLNNVLQLKDANICTLQSNLASEQKQKSDLQIKQKEEIATMEKKEEMLQNQLNELESKATLTNSTCCELRKQLADTFEQKSGLELKIKAESNRYKQTCKSLQEETNSLREREKKILEECDVNISKAKDYCSEVRRQLEKTNKQLEDVMKENKHLSETLERNNKNLQKLKSVNENLNSAIQIERETNSSLKKRMESQELKYEEMRQKLESALKDNKQYATEISRLKTSIDYSDRKIREYKQILEHTGTIHLGDSTHFRKVKEQEDCNNFDDPISSLTSTENVKSHTNSDDSLHVIPDETILTADQVMLQRETLACTSDLQKNPSACNLSQTEDCLSLCSTSSAQSVKSRTDVQDGIIPNANSCADKPEDPADFEWNHLNELQRRNTLYLPHMKSAYPVDLQSVRKRITDDSIRLSLMPNGRGKASPSRFNTRQKDSKTSRSGCTNPLKIDVHYKMAVKHKTLLKQSSDDKSFESPPKQVRTSQQLYQRPDQLTPGKRSRKISRRLTQSRGISLALGSPVGQPYPRCAPGKLPSRRSLRLSSHVTESPVSNDDRRQSVAFNIGFTPDKSKAPNIFLEKTEFGSKHINSRKTNVIEETEAKCDIQVSSPEGRDIYVQESAVTYLANCDNLALLELIPCFSDNCVSKHCSKINLNTESTSYDPLDSNNQILDRMNDENKLESDQSISAIKHESNEQNKNLSLRTHFETALGIKALRFDDTVSYEKDKICSSNTSSDDVEERELRSLTECSDPTVKLQKDSQGSSEQSGLITNVILETNCDQPFLCAPESLQANHCKIKKKPVVIIDNYSDTPSGTGNNSFIKSHEKPAKRKLFSNVDTESLIEKGILSGNYVVNNNLEACTTAIHVGKKEENRNVNKKINLVSNLKRKFESSSGRFVKQVNSRNQVNDELGRCIRLEEKTSAVDGVQTTYLKHNSKMNYQRSGTIMHTSELPVIIPDKNNFLSDCTNDIESQQPKKLKFSSFMKKTFSKKKKIISPTSQADPNPNIFKSRHSMDQKVAQLKAKFEPPKSGPKIKEQCQIVHAWLPVTGFSEFGLAHSNHGSEKYNFETKDLSTSQNIVTTKSKKNKPDCKINPKNSHLTHYKNPYSPR